jgi:hypothetical protein
MTRYTDQEKVAHLGDLFELRMFLGKILKLDPQHARATAFMGLVKLQQHSWEHAGHLPKHLRLDKTKVHELLDPELARLRAERKNEDAS